MVAVGTMRLYCHGMLLLDCTAWGRLISAHNLSGDGSSRSDSPDALRQPAASSSFPGVPKALPTPPLHLSVSRSPPGQRPPANAHGNIAAGGLTPRLESAGLPGMRVAGAPPRWIFKSQQWHRKPRPTDALWSTRCRGFLPARDPPVRLPPPYEVRAPSRCNALLASPHPFPPAPLAWAASFCSVTSMAIAVDSSCAGGRDSRSQSYVTIRCRC